MILASELKRIINSIPDNVPVCINDAYECDITGFVYDTSKGYAKLTLTEGFSIATDEFIDDLFAALKSR